MPYSGICHIERHTQNRVIALSWAYQPAHFTRALLWSPKAGGGHHSPIGGYLEKEDLVFVLDVYDPYKPFLNNFDSG